MRNSFAALMVAFFVSSMANAHPTATIQCGVKSTTVRTTVSELHLVNCKGDLLGFKGNDKFIIAFSPFLTKVNKDDYRQIFFGPENSEARWTTTWAKGTVIDVARYAAKAMSDQTEMKMVFDSTNPKNPQLVTAYSIPKVAAAPAAAKKAAR